MTQLQNDIELCQAVRMGQRDAFRRVVERYQGLVTSITYNATGDIPISEDLAQDIFLQAWRKIGSLKDPSKLPGWLCAIARNRVRDWLRRRHTDIGSQTVSLVDATPPATAEPSPESHIERQEESALVWRAIESIPNDYREVLILHYREQADAAEIARSLEISEAAVRQRLSRARAMVKQEVAGLVERGLRSTRPSQAFTIAVMASLSAVTPSVATAAVGGGAAGKSAGSLLSMSIFIGPVLGLLGGIYGTWLSIKHTDSSTERSFMMRFALAIWLMIIVFLTLLMAAPVLLQDRLSTVGFLLAEAAIILAYIAVLVPVILWGSKRQKTIRQEQGSPELGLVMRHAWASPKGVYGGLSVAVFGAMAWMVVFAMQAADWLTAGLVTVAAIGIVVLSAEIMKRYGDRATRAVLCGLTGSICGVTLLVLDTRLFEWIGQFDGRTAAEVKADLPPWTLMVLTISAFVVVMAVVNLSLASKPRGHAIHPSSSSEAAPGTRR